MSFFRFLQQLMTRLFANVPCMLFHHDSKYKMKQSARCSQTVSNSIFFLVYLIWSQVNLLICVLSVMGFRNRCGSNWRKTEAQML